MAARPPPWPPIGLQRPTTLPPAPPRPPGPPPGPALAAGPRAPQWNPPAVAPAPVQAPFGPSGLAPAHTPVYFDLPDHPPDIRVPPPGQLGRNPGAPAGPPAAQSQAPKPRPPVAAFAVYLQIMVPSVFGNPDDATLKLQLNQRGWSFLATNDRGNVEPEERGELVKLVVMSRKSQVATALSAIRKFPNAHIVVVGKLESGTLENDRVKIVNTHDEALQLATYLMEQIKGGPQTIPAPKFTPTPPTTVLPKKEQKEKEDRNKDKEKQRQAASALEQRDAAAVAAFEKAEQEKKEKEEAKRREADRQKQKEQKKKRKEDAEKQKKESEKKAKEEQRKEKEKKKQEERAKLNAYKAKLQAEKAICFSHRDEPNYEFTNFWPCNMRLDRKLWSAAEHYFQAQKFIHYPLAQEAIRTAGEASDAVDIATRYDQLKRAEWEDVKEDVMHRAVNAKFQQNKDLRLMLLRTGTKRLVYHTKTDNYWGDGGDGTGKNMLGQTLMLVRDEMMPGFAHELGEVHRDDGPGQLPPQRSKQPQVSYPAGSRPEQSSLSFGPSPTALAQAQMAEIQAREDALKRKHEEHENALKAQEAKHKAELAELRAREEALKRQQAERERQLEAEFSKLRVPEVPSSELKLIKKEPLGQGSFKTAWLCEWRRQQVVKQEFRGAPTGETLKSFNADFEFLYALRHGNVLRLMAKVTGELSLVTEYCERGSLHDILHAASEKEEKAGKPLLPPDKQWFLLLQLASALEFLHNQPKPVVHRDVKSANCLITVAWTLKLADFGLARTQQATAGFSTAGKGVGTYNFMAPEQFDDQENTAKISTKSDIYAFGGVMIDVLTGFAPFTGVTSKTIYQSVCMKELKPAELKKIPERSPAAEFATRCLDQDPAKRPTASDAVAFCKAQLAAAEKAAAAPASFGPALSEFTGDYRLPIDASKLAQQPDYKELRIGSLSLTGNKPTGLADAHHAKIMQWLRATGDPDLLGVIKRIDLVYNENHFTRFCLCIPDLAARVQNPAFRVTLAQGEDEQNPRPHAIVQAQLARRQRVLHRMMNLTRQVSHSFVSKGVNMVRAWHGTSKKVADSIIRNGFAALVTMDDGWYGKGIYFSSSPTYARRYCDPPSGGCLILCYLLTPSPYPIIEEDAPRHLPMEEARQFRFYAKGAHRKFFCHYVEVGPCDDEPGCMDYRPPLAGAGPDAAPFDEIIIFQEAHILPHAVVHLD